VTTWLAPLGLAVALALSAIAGLRRFERRLHPWRAARAPPRGREPRAVRLSP
jgi:hypothetical protein